MRAYTLFSRAFRGPDRWRVWARLHRIYAEIALREKKASKWIVEGNEGNEDGENLAPPYFDVGRAIT